MVFGGRRIRRLRMKYRLIVFDIDGTITRHVSSWRYIHEKLGLWDALARKYQEQFLAGKISYRKFCELDAAHWKGMGADRLYDIFGNVRYSKNAKPAVVALKKMGFKLVAVSTGLQFITDRIKKELGFHCVLGNRLNTRKGRLTGGVTINISHGAKARAMLGILKRFDIKPGETIAVGDSESDIPMARLAGYSIAFNCSSQDLSRVVDYDCRSFDFMEVHDRILAVSGVGRCDDKG